MYRLMRSGLLLLVLLVLAACGNSVAPSSGTDAPVEEPTPIMEPTPMSEPTTAPTPEGSATPEPATTPTPSAEGGRDLPTDALDMLPNVTVQVMEMLAAQTGLAQEEMEVLVAEQVEWPNAALGCPEPGQMYSEMIVPGYHFVIEANGETFDIGTDADVSRLAICDKG